MESVDPRQQQLQGLALLLQLQRKARASEDTAALGFTMVNETRSLLPYRQAALWLAGPLAQIKAVSGVALLEAHAPYLVWLRETAEALFSSGDNVWRAFSANDLPASLAERWMEWCAPYGLALGLRDQRSGACFGALLLFREQAWHEGEITLLLELADAYTHAWQALQPRQPWLRSLLAVKHSRWWWLAPAVLLIPVRLSVLAPAEIAAIDPTLVRAPLDGVVDQFHVQPNQQVENGQLLLSLENTDIANRLEVAHKALAVAEAEHRSNAQLAVLENKNKAELSVLKSKIDQHAAEVGYLQDQFARSEIRAPHAGIAVFADAQDWLGKPVSVGERILQIADASRVEVWMELPVADLIALEDGAETVMYLNSDPQHPLTGKLYSVAYQPEATAENVLAYRLKAHLDGNEPPPRIGLKGTAKIYGPKVSLFYYLFRRPLAGLRQWLGM